MFDGKRGSPELWVARCNSVISAPFRVGTVTSGPSRRCTGISSSTAPSPARSASRIAVNALVIEPISNTVSPSTSVGLSVAS